MSTMQHNSEKGATWWISVCVPVMDWTTVQSAVPTFSVLSVFPGRRANSNIVFTHTLKLMKQETKHFLFVKVLMQA